MNERIKRLKTDNSVTMLEIPILRKVWPDLLIYFRDELVGRVRNGVYQYFVDQELKSDLIKIIKKKRIKYYFINTIEKDRLDFLRSTLQF